ncbi:TonB-dependent receptor [Gillisia sp. Hel_I_29]|uniref:TonB-dependent receptor n=1 Tax=Gillisia sp. Hel_I_29 TaxID=1249975 RepID=UPI000553176A|nr:TonB-dependent receptor [Gillisia sp. Hel_I_29]
MHKILYMLIALAIATNAYSQNPVIGKVKDAETNLPIAGVTLYFPQLEKGTSSNLDGEFEFKNIPDGNFNLIITSIGYSSKTLNLTIPNSQNLEILLQASAIEMETVIVSTPFHQLQSDNVMKVERENVSDLKKRGALNLAEGITQIPGVESVTTGAGIGKPVIRGLSSNRVLVYTQGVRLENQQFGDEHGLGVSASGVESVEVIKGPASLLYGSDALGGVLYLNPEKYAPQQSTHADAKYAYQTNTLGSEYNLGVKTSGKNLKFLARGNYATHSDYETGSDIRVTNTRFKELDLKTGVGFQTQSYKGDLRYNYNNSKLGIPEEIGAQSTSKDQMQPNQEVDNHVLSLDNKFYLKNSSIDVKLGYLFNNRKEFEEEEGEDAVPAEITNLDPALELHLNTLNYDVKYNTAKWGKFQTIFGIQGMHQTNENLGEEVLIPDATVTDFGILATTHYHLEKIDFQGGFRFDTRNIDSQEMGIVGEEKYFAPLDRSFTSYNGAIGAKFDLFTKLSTRINLASGFRAPNLAELTSNGTHEGTNRYEIGNPDLDNEQNFQIDVAFEYQNEHFEIFANPFYNIISNYIFINPSGELIDGNPVFDYVQNDVRLYGGEAGLHLHPHPIDWLHLESNFEIVRGEQKDGEDLPLIPAASITNTLRTEFSNVKGIANSYAFISSKSVLDQDHFSTFETRTPGYTLFSAGFGGAFAVSKLGVDFNVSANNLFNKSYISHLSRLKPDGIQDRGRNITLSLRTSI